MMPQTNSKNADNACNKIKRSTAKPKNDAANCACQWGLLDAAKKFDIEFLVQKIASCIYDPEFYFTMPEKLRINAIIIDAVLMRYPHLWYVEEIKNNAAYATVKTITTIFYS